MKNLNGKLMRSLVSYKNALWVKRSQYNTTYNKLKNNVTDFAYEFLVYLKNDETNSLRICIFMALWIWLWEYVRYNFFNRNRTLARTAVYIHEDMKNYEINPAKDEIDANNYNKLHYSRVYTQKY
jgi:hypothetical protein